MKTTFTAIIIVISSLWAQIAMSQNNDNHQNKGKLTVVVEGISSDKGSIMISVRDSSKKFQPTFASKVSSDEGVEFEFDNLVVGLNEIMIIHDENGNGTLDRGEYGMPIEGYGILPGADKMNYVTKAEVTEQGATITIVICYLSKINHVI